MLRRSQENVIASTSAPHNSQRMQVEPVRDTAPSHEAAKPAKRRRPTHQPDHGLHTHAEGPPQPQEQATVPLAPVVSTRPTYERQGSQAETHQPPAHSISQQTASPGPQTSQFALNSSPSEGSAVAKFVGKAEQRKAALAIAEAKIAMLEAAALDHQAIRAELTTAHAEITRQAGELAVLQRELRKSRNQGQASQQEATQCREAARSADAIARAQVQLVMTSLNDLTKLLCPAVQIVLPGEAATSVDSFRDSLVQSVSRITSSVQAQVSDLQGQISRQKASVEQSYEGQLTALRSGAQAADSTIELLRTQLRQQEQQCKELQADNKEAQRQMAFLTQTFNEVSESSERSRRYLEDELAKRSSECAGILQNSENFSKMLESATKQHQADDEKLAAYEKRVLEDAKKQAATFDELTNTQRRLREAENSVLDMFSQQSETAQRVEQERSALSLHSATQLQRLAEEKTSLEKQLNETSTALKLAEHEGVIHRARIIEAEEKLEEAIENERLLQQQHSTQQKRIDDDAACIGRLQQERAEIEKTLAACRQIMCRDEQAPMGCAGSMDHEGTAWSLENFKEQFISTSKLADQRKSDIDQLRQQYDRAQSERNALLSQVEAKEKAITVLSGSFTRLEREISHLRDQLDTQARSQLLVDESTLNLHNLRVEFAEIKAELARSLERSSELEQKQHGAATKLGEEATLRQTAEEECERLKLAATELREKVAMLTGERSVLESQITSLKADIHNSYETQQRSASATAIATANLVHAEANVEDLRSQLQARHDQTGVLEEARAQIRALQTELQAARASCAQVEQTLAASEKGRVVAEDASRAAEKKLVDERGEAAHTARLQVRHAQERLNRDIAAKDNELKKLRRKLADLEDRLCKATESRLQVKQGPSIPQDSDTSQSDLSSLSALIDPHDTLVEAPASAEKIAASVSSIEATKLLGRSSERTDVSAADEIMLDGKDDPLKAGFSSSDPSSRSRIPPGRPVNRANKARVNKPVSEPCKTTTHQDTPKLPASAPSTRPVRRQSSRSIPQDSDASDSAADNSRKRARRQ